jgi:uncharacterized protein YdcH (DUF465 family)
MEITQDSLKAQLMETDEQFRSLATQHAEFKQRVEQLEHLSHPTEEQMAEEVQLKKKKLQLKDQMAEIMTRYKTEHHLV